MTDKKIAFYSDEQLLSLIRQDNRLAFAQLYNKYWTRLYQSAYAILGERPASEDVIQQVMVDLWTRRQSSHILSLEAYLYGAVRYQVLKIIRSGKVRQQVFARIQQLSLDHHPASPTEDRLLENELLHLIDDCVTKLPPMCRQIFHLSRYEHLSTKDIASRLGITPKTVENQLTIALRRLRTVVGHSLSWLMLIFMN